MQEAAGGLLLHLPVYDAACELFLNQKLLEPKWLWLDLTMSHKYDFSLSNAIIVLLFLCECEHDLHNYPSRSLANPLSYVCAEGENDL